MPQTVRNSFQVYKLLILNVTEKKVKIVAKKNLIAKDKLIVNGNNIDGLNMAGSALKAYSKYTFWPNSSKLLHTK